MIKIIAFGGRKHSGKTTFSEVLRNKLSDDYDKIIKLSFATPVKKLCCSIFNIDDETLNEYKLKNFKTPFVFSEKERLLLEKETGLSISSDYVNKKLHNSREIMQFIATDIIRNIDKDWHVNKVKKIINEYKNTNENILFIIDDVRFKNELSFLRCEQAKLYYIVSNKNDVYNCHESERDISILDFSLDNEVFINIFNLENKKESENNFYQYYKNYLYKRCNRNILGQESIGRWEYYIKYVSKKVKEETLRAIFILNREDSGFQDEGIIKFVPKSIDAECYKLINRNPLFMNYLTTKQWLNEKGDVI